MVKVGYSDGIICRHLWNAVVHKRRLNTPNVGDYQMSRKALHLPKEVIQDALDKTESAYAASILVGATYTSFIRYAKMHGIYKTNQGGKGYTKPKPRKFSLQELLVKDRATRTSSASLKARVIDAGLLKNECDECGLQPEWQGKKLVLHLEHTNGDHQDNRLENLRLLCPNCHSQTDTYCRGQYRGGRKTLSAGVAKPGDASDLGSDSCNRRGGSSPLTRTK